MAETPTAVERKWETEDAARSLIEAEKVKQRMKTDKKFGKAVRKELAKRVNEAAAAKKTAG